MMPDWQSMKCAPRDGTAILLVVEGKTVASWWLQAVPEALGAAFSGWHCCSKFDEPPRCKPTAWRPMPAPPPRRAKGRARWAGRWPYWIASSPVL
jgi:hypothetical protein